MKKITLLLALCFAFQFNVIAQVLIPDANFEQVLIDANIDTGGIAGEISTAQAQAVVGTLNISNSLIADFTGIEGFINITGLNAGYNAMAPSLDVTAIAGLTLVDVEGCALLTSLTTTGLTALVEIQGTGAALTALDVTTNTALQSLNVRNNSIAILDLSFNTVLVEMDAKSNGLTDLDMRNGNNANVTFFDSDINNDLTCIYVDDASSGYLLTWSNDLLSTFVNDEADCNTLTVDTNNKNAFKMFPNPVKNTVFVKAITQESQLSIYDITGKLILTELLSLGQNSVDVSQMASGVYLARFVADGLEQTKKLIIQ